MGCVDKADNKSSPGNRWGVCDQAKRGFHSSSASRIMIVIFFVGHRGCHMVWMGFHQWELKVGGGLGWASFLCALCLFTCQAKKALMGPTYIDLAEC